MREKKLQFRSTVTFVSFLIQKLSQICCISPYFSAVLNKSFLRSSYFIPFSSSVVKSAAIFQGKKSGGRHLAFVFRLYQKCMYTVQYTQSLKTTKIRRKNKKTRKSKESEQRLQQSFKTRKFEKTRKTSESKKKKSRKINSNQYYFP